MSPVTKALLAGLCFGIWPLLMNRSGLNGNASTVILSAFIAMFALPLALREPFDPLSVSWSVAACTCVIGALGMLFFNSMLSRAVVSEVSVLFVLVILVQVAAPAVYQVFLDKGISVSRGVGFALVPVVAYLLSRK